MSVAAANAPLPPDASFLACQHTHSPATRDTRNKKASRKGRDLKSSTLCDKGLNAEMHNLTRRAAHGAGRTIPAPIV